MKYKLKIRGKEKEIWFLIGYTFPWGSWNMCLKISFTDANSSCLDISEIIKKFRESFLHKIWGTKIRTCKTKEIIFLVFSIGNNTWITTSTIMDSISLCRDAFYIFILLLNRPRKNWISFWNQCVIWHVFPVFKIPRKTSFLKIFGRTSRLPMPHSNIITNMGRTISGMVHLSTH